MSKKRISQLILILVLIYMLHKMGDAYKPVHMQSILGVTTRILVSGHTVIPSNQTALPLVSAVHVRVSPLLAVRTRGQGLSHECTW